MTDQVENLILEHLKALRNELRAFQTEARVEFSDIKQRLHGIDSSVLSTKRDQLSAQQDVARQQVSIDQIVERLQRLERRLELNDAP